MTQYIVYNLAFRNPKQWVEEEKRKSRKGVTMTQYDCALCHLPAVFRFVFFVKPTFTLLSEIPIRV